MATRSYRSPLRAEAQAATRRRIIDAAARLFAERGYPGTTMAAIAAEAGVSVQSVHLAGPKSALLMAAFEVAFAGDEGTHSLNERPSLASVFELSPEDALPAYARFLSQANAASVGVWLALVSAARDDEEVAALVDDQRRRRNADIGHGVEWAAAQGLLTGGASKRTRREVMTWVVSPETFDFFVRESGWSVERYENWLMTALRTMVLHAE